MDEFQSISPYTDEQTVEALARVAGHPAIPAISKYLFSSEPAGTLSKMLRSVKNVDDFQDNVMIKAVGAIIEKTSEGVTYDGIENLKQLGDKKFLLVSNHRDIILDPAIIQWILFREGIPMTQICVGSNLLGSQLVEDLMRSNRMIKVIRGISARELYFSSQLLSKYIRKVITTGESSVWVAQKEGRTKNGMDATEQGVLKMFDMSSEKSFEEGFRELNIVPVSISYEYEPCDIRKTRELLISRTRKYVKKPNEDLHSIMTGIKQSKGHIHFSFGETLTDEEIRKAGEWHGNDRYQAIRRAMDKRIISGYRLWKTNYIAYDMLNGGNRYSQHYSPEEYKAFDRYVKHKIGKQEFWLNRYDMTEIFLRIYANPIVNKITNL